MHGKMASGWSGENPSGIVYNKLQMYYKPMSGRRAVHYAQVRRLLKSSRKTGGMLMTIFLLTNVAISS